MLKATQLLDVLIAQPAEIGPKTMKTGIFKYTNTSR